MRNLNSILFILVTSITTSSCAIANDVKNNDGDLSLFGKQISETISNGNLNKLQSLLNDNKITFDSKSNIAHEVKCHIDWEVQCGGSSTNIRKIAKNPNFIYYYHISNSEVIISYIDSNHKDKFYSNTEQFLETEYLKSYFSCHAVKIGKRWLLTESLCYAETEGPFEPEPDL